MNQAENHIRDVRIIRKIMVPMRDNIKLATTVYLPRDQGSYPVVLLRTIYNRMALGELGLVQRGFAVITQDGRGRYASEGEFYPFINEEADGLDTLDWLEKQPWCNGKVGMLGNSYLAATQFAVAAKGHRVLASLNPCFMAGDPWRQGYYCDGVFSLALTYTWLVLECGSPTSEANLLPLYDVKNLLSALPLLTLDEKFGEPLKSYRDYVTHCSRDAFWQNLCWRDLLGKSAVPMLLTGGWYDYYPNETFRNYEALLKGDASEAIKQKHRVVIGPWAHGVNGSSILGQLDFGSQALLENDGSIRWLECTLKTNDVSEAYPAPIRIFVMGENVWRDEPQWPLARTQYTRFYLHSLGHANFSLENGVLSTTAPTDAEIQTSDRFIYNPADPVPTLGGNHSIGIYNPGVYDLVQPGPYDQRPIEAREDVLVYSTMPLRQDVEVTGPIRLRLFATTTARDTDFTAQLTDVYPDGRSINITQGVIRARFVARDWANPQLLEPGKIYEYTIELQPTSNLFKQGHRIRLNISSSNFPLWDRNLNTGQVPGLGTTMVQAQQTILHDAEHSSYLELPVIPR